MGVKISVVTPTKDRPEAIELCRRWFREQTYPIHEHIVVDGGTAAENTAEGIDQATGDVILLADDDDYYAPGWTRWIAAAYASEPVIMATGHKTMAMYHIRAGLRHDCDKPPLPGSISFRIEQRPAVKLCMARANKPQLILKDVRHSLPQGTFVYRIMGMYHSSLPGRGLSRKHNPNRFSIPDTDLAFLRSRIGSGIVDRYLDAIERIDQRLGQ